MIREALQNIEELAVKAQKVEIIRPDQDPRRAFVASGGKLEPIELRPPARNHVVLSLDDFKNAVQKWGGDGTVWHNEKHLVLVVDDKDRWDRVTFPLAYSSPFTVLRSLEEQKRRFQQKEFVALLRHELAGVVPDFILPRIRKVEASSSGRQAGEVQHGRERGTREFQAELVGAEELPEQFDARVGVYQNLPELDRVQVRLNLDISLPPAVMDFSLLPLPDACDDAERAAQQQLHAMLVEDFDETLVYYGTP